MAPGSRLEDAAHEREVEEEEDDEGVSDNPLPAWMEGDSLAPPCQADMDVVRAIVDFAGVTADDVLYDLGCGDGRICIEAAESRGAKACGVEIEEDLADKFRRRVAAKGLESKVSVVHGDLRDVDLSDATVVVMYLLPDAMADIAQSHLLPLLRRGHGTPATTATSPLPGDSATQRGTAGREEAVVEGRTVDSEGAPGVDNQVVSTERGNEEGRRRGDGGSDGGGVGGSMKPCRIVCNTWGVPGATAVREAGVGLHGGVKLRLFTHASLPSVA
ncbi:unnamed protein product [Ectocarpus fasciculatus]